ncbi:MAG: hypothetical protein ACPGJV_13045, partial [Bacteriovoracaceae bacterium]
MKKQKGVKLLDVPFYFFDFEFDPSLYETLEELNVVTIKNLMFLTEERVREVPSRLDPKVVLKKVDKELNKAGYSRLPPWCEDMNLFQMRSMKQVIM